MKVELFKLERRDWVPNNKSFPVMAYRVVGPTMGSDNLGQLFAGNGWNGIWRNGVFGYHHYHSGAHEVLGAGRGFATLMIGGPGGITIKVSTGDCLILPAGTGHMKCHSSHDFQVVGAYPPGQHADFQTTAPTLSMLEAIRLLPRPNSDPVFGSSVDSSMPGYNREDLTDSKQSDTIPTPNIPGSKMSKPHPYLAAVRS